MPPPVPPSSIAAMAASSDVTIWLRGDSRPIRSIASRNNCRSSALAIESRRAPINSMPSRSNVPSSARDRAVFRAVCPPMVGNSASGRSRSSTRPTISGVIGSI